ncbi:hypothetical protein BJY04DRAFT_219726 [Aspergillus karnatakaensis]|uniref:uncharacterized protein n=1 Tax=Aspergillus karnatakaensis TaxID=1810916 RepID=UPI003CCCDEDD
MVIEVETVGLVLAVLPLLVNQLDNYARGIQHVKLLRRYHRTLADYALKLRTQHAIFLNNLEQALDGVVDDDDQIQDLINNPDGDPWKDPVLQQNLRRKLDRNCDYFLENMASLYSMLIRLAKKFDLNLTRQMPNPSTPSKKDTLLPIKLLQKAVYDDLLQQIRDLNDVLKTLIEQSSQAKTNRARRSPWRQLLPQFRAVRRSAEGVFQAIMHGSHWSCPCRDSHCAHLQVRSNPIPEKTKYSNGPKLRVSFSTSAVQNTTCNWGWSEVEFETCQQEQSVSATTLALNEKHSSANVRASRVRFEITTTTQALIKTAACKASIETTMGDMCSVFSGGVKHAPTSDGVAYLIPKPHLNMRFKMRSIRCSQQAVPLRTLQDALPASNRRDRLYIAVGLASSVMQYHGNWLKPQWSCSDIPLPKEYNGDADAPPEDLYISCPLDYQPPATNDPPTPLIRNRILFPLAIALIELSLGQTLVSLQIPEDNKGDIKSTQFYTTSRLLNRVYRESGSNYHDAVHTCLFGPSMDGPCFWNERF